MANEIENYFDADHYFDAQDGLFVAAALTGYNDETEIEEDERFGKLVIEHYGWGYEDSESTGSKSTPLETHACSD